MDALAAAIDTVGYWASPLNTILLGILVWLLERLDKRVSRVETWIMNRAEPDAKGTV